MLNDVRDTIPATPRLQCPFASHLLGTDQEISEFRNLAEESKRREEVGMVPRHCAHSRVSRAQLLTCRKTVTVSLTLERKPEQKQRHPAVTLSESLR